MIVFGCVVLELWEARDAQFAISAVCELAAVKQYCPQGVSQSKIEGGGEG